jgi:hypothetical protein
MPTEKGYRRNTSSARPEPALRWFGNNVTGDRSEKLNDPTPENPTHFTNH